VNENLAVLNDAKALLRVLDTVEQVHAKHSPVRYVAPKFHRPY
jgi:hypothetical protein